MDEQAATPVADEALFQQSLAELRSPKPVQITSLVLTLLMMVFVVGLFMNLRSMTSVLLLCAAVVIHEAGHALGMRAFGFRDIQMFFIPFFGAAVSGRERGTAAWKEAVVSLLGPIPGLLLGVLLLVWVARQPVVTKLPFEFIGALLWINAFNLLPFGFLDGGQFIERVLFSRHPVLEVASRVVGYLVLGLVAIQGGMHLLGLFIGFSLLGLPARWRLLRAAASLRRQRPSLESDPERISEADARALFLAARGALSAPANERPSALGRTMESILNATKKAPRALATTGLLFAYGFGFVVAVLGLAWLSIFVGPVSWQKVTGAGWRAEFPRQPFAAPAGTGWGGARTTTWAAVVDGAERFTVDMTPGADDRQWMNAIAEKLAKTTTMKLAGTRPVRVGGYPATEFEFSVSGRTMRSRMVAVYGRRYTATASAPKWGANQQRFLDSFAVTDSSPLGGAPAAGDSAAVRAPEAAGDTSTATDPPVTGHSSARR